MSAGPLGHPGAARQPSCLCGLLMDIQRPFSPLKASLMRLLLSTPVLPRTEGRSRKHTVKGDGAPAPMWQVSRTSKQSLYHVCVCVHVQLCIPFCNLQSVHQLCMSAVSSAQCDEPVSLSVCGPVSQSEYTVWPAWCVLQFQPVWLRQLYVMLWGIFLGHIMIQSVLYPFNDILMHRWFFSECLVLWRSH